MELEKTANLRQDIVKASLIFFRKAGEELIGPQGIVFCRRHGIGKNIVKDRGNGDTQGGGDFCQSFYGDVFLPTLHLANVRGMEPGAVCQGFLAVALFLSELPQFTADGLRHHRKIPPRKDYKYYLPE